MRRHLPASLFLPACLFALAATARADNLVLTPGAPLDIQALGLSSIGDLAFDLGAVKLWICDGAANGQIYKLNPISGALIATIDPSVISGLHFGPDALAVAHAQTTPDVYAFSPFGESEGGSVTQSGALAHDFGTANNATGADFDSAGNLWIVAGTVVNGGASLRQLDPTTGATIQTVQILGNTSRIVDVAFDPLTGACYCLTESTSQLLEVSLPSGVINSTTDLAPFVTQPGIIAGGIAFDGHGSKLFVATGASGNTGSIVVLERDYSLSVCDGFSSPCPCGNAGQPGRGCENSASTGGALLDTLNVPSIAFDSLLLRASHLPSNSTALFFQGTGAPVGPPTAFGDGLRCVTGTIVRLGIKTVVNGQANYPTTGDPDVSVAGLIVNPSSVRFYQVWYRNAANFCTASTFNLSNSIRVFWGP